MKRNTKRFFMAPAAIIDDQSQIKEIDKKTALMYKNLYTKNLFNGFLFCILLKKDEKIQIDMLKGSLAF
jgi:hypothetical protein